MTRTASRGLIAAIVAALVIGAAGTVVVTAALDDDDSSRLQPAAPQRDLSTTVAEVLRDRDGFEAGEVRLSQAEITRRLSDHLAIIDGAALLVSPRRPLGELDRGDTVDVRGEAVVLPMRQFVEDWQATVPRELFEVAGVDPDAVARVELLVVASSVAGSTR